MVVLSLLFKNEIPQWLQLFTMQQIVHKGLLHQHLLFGCLLFYYFLIWSLWLELLILCWIKVVRASISSFLPQIRRIAFSFSSLNMLLAVHLSWMVFLMLRYVPSIPTLLNIYHKCMLNFVKCFVCFYWDTTFTFGFV